MADPLPVASTPGVYATYPGRAVPGSIPDRVAPDLEPAYHRLAPDADVFYGTFLPVAFNRPGSARWMREGTNFRWSLPAIVRDGLLGALDLANGTHTGEVTPRLAQTFAFGLPMAGIGLAERGSLGMAGALPPKADLPMDVASRMERARAMGFDPDRRLYHGTADNITPGFRSEPARRTTASWAAPVGVWTAESPSVAAEFAAMAAKGRGAPGDSGQNILPLYARRGRTATLRLGKEDLDHEVAATLADAFDNGYDSVRLLNYTTPGGIPGQTTWVFKDPSQLRAPFAAFDPARCTSNDLLAGSAVPAPLAVTASAPEQRTPGFRGPPSLAESLAYWRFMHEPKVY
jgi:hypothetical protein